MPIYAYRCATCSHAQDVLQKMSDPVLTTCPACGAETYTKQVTAAGFQLKGSGWYVTDFRGGNNAPAAKKEGDAPGAAEKGAEKGAEKDAEAPAGAAAAKPADAAAAPAPAAKTEKAAAPPPSPATPAAGS